MKFNENKEDDNTGKNFTFIFTLLARTELWVMDLTGYYGIKKE